MPYRMPKMSDAPAELVAAEATVQEMKRQLEWCRTQIRVSLESIAVANGATREEAAAQPIVVAAREACDRVARDIALVEANIPIVRAFALAHPELADQRPPPAIYSQWGNVNAGLMGARFGLERLVAQLQS